MIQKMMKPGAFLLLLMLAGTTAVWAQETDLSTWLSVEVTKDITKKIGLEFEEEVRIFNDFGEIDRFSSSLGGTWSVMKYLKASAGYAWLYNHNVKNAYWEHRHRVYAQLTGKADWGRFAFSLRERFQSTAYDQSRKGFNYTPRRYLRSRLKVAYNIPKNKAEPYLSAEFHRQLNNPWGNSTDNYRYTLGVDFPLNKTLDLDTFVRLDRDIGTKKTVNLWIAGITLLVGL